MKHFLMGMGWLGISLIQIYAMDNNIQTYLSDNHFSGCVLISRKSEIIYHQAYGYKDKEKGILNTLETAFPIASVTKPLTATVLLKVLNQTNLTLEAKVSEFIQFDFNVNPTLQALLHHTSGFSLYTDFTKNDHNREEKLVSTELYEMLAAPVNRPFPTFEYNNGNYIILGHILEKITGKTYREVFAQELFSPLQMETAGFVTQTQMSPNYAHGYVANYSKAPVIDESWLGCGAGVYATTTDLYKFIQAYVGEDFISPTLRQKMCQFNSHFYGLGWTLKEENTPTCFYHEGGISGFSSFLLHDPAKSLTIIALANREINIEKIVWDLHAMT